MRYFLIGCLGVLGSVTACQQPATNKVEISLNTALLVDTLVVQDLITKQRIATFHADKTTHEAEVNEPFIAAAHLKKQPKHYLTFLEPGNPLQVSVTPDGQLNTNRLVDSLLNAVWQGTATFIAKQSSFLFSTNNNDSVVAVFEDFRLQRAASLAKFSEELSAPAMAMLNYQSDARVYAFLFFLGRISKGLPADDSFYNFSQQIPPPDARLKSLPDIYLYQYEVAYLRQHKQLKDIPSFMRYIEQETNNTILSDYLKAVYLKALIQNPSYWEKHEELFDTATLTRVLSEEKNNAYAHLFTAAANAFFATQQGEVAYDFEALNQAGDTVRLSDFKGKVVFIDTWATWCAPCIRQRPQVIDLAKKHAANHDLVFLFISVDASKAAWTSFMNKQPATVGQHLYIRNGMRTTFGDQYNIKSIPRYMLIGKDGRIIDANMAEPSAAIEALMIAATTQ